MANALYDKGREAFLRGRIDWINDTIKVALVKVPSSAGASPAADEYKVNLSTHQFLSSVPSGAILKTQVLIRTDLDNHAANGVADANNITFDAVTGTIGALVIYKQSDSGDPASSYLIAYLDQLNGLPYNPQGGNVTIQWDNGTNRIFKL